MRFRPKNIRTRLTLWYTLILTLVILLFAFLSLGGLYWKLTGELDDLLAEDYEIIERLIEIDEQNRVVFPEPSDPELHDRWFEVWSAEGKLIYQSRSTGDLTLGPPPAASAFLLPIAFTSVRLKNGQKTRQLSGTLNLEGRRFFIRIARGEDEIWAEVKKVATFMGVAFFIVIALSLAGGNVMARRLLRPIDWMTQKTRQISAENLNERLPVANPHDELGRLALVINSMLDRIQRAFEQLRRFTSDAAHELRTPLTALRSVGEVGLQDAKLPHEYREIIGSMLEEVNRLNRLVDNLLLLTRADAAQVQLKKETIPLLKEVNQIVDMMQALAEEKRQFIAVCGDGSLRADVDRLIFRQMLVNIIDNAIKYSPEGEVIRVKVQQAENGFVRIDVRDKGPGIPPEHREKIFERFYRVDKSRSREMGGTGLGLSIAKWAAEVHGGRIELESEVGVGSTFRIILPGWSENEEEM